MQDLKDLEHFFFLDVLMSLYTSSKNKSSFIVLLPCNHPLVFPNGLTCKVVFQPQCYRRMISFIYPSGALSGQTTSVIVLPMTVLYLACLFKKKKKID